MKKRKYFFILPFLIVTLVGCSSGSGNNDDLVNLLVLNQLNKPKPIPQKSGPSGLEVVSNEVKKATISWEPVEGAIVYRLYYTKSLTRQSITLSGTINPPSEPPDPEKVEESNETIIRVNNVESPYTLENLELGYSYKFAVTYVDGESESDLSEPVILDEVYPSLQTRRNSIWAIGGLATSYGSEIAEIDLFDIQNNLWIPNFTQLPIPVSFAAIESWNNKIYVCGGFNRDELPTGLMQVYDVITDTWENKNPGNTACHRANHEAVSYNGKIFILGGTTTGAKAMFTGATNTDIYHIIANSWTQGLAFGAAHGNRSICLLDGVIFNNGGRSAAATLATTHDGYIIDSNALTTAQTEVALTAAVAGHSLVCYRKGGFARMWKIGGVSAITGTTSSGVNGAGTSAYTPLATNNVQVLSSPFVAPATWQNPVDLQLTGPRQVGFGSAFVDPSNGNVYFSGGNPTLAPNPSTQFIRSNMHTEEAWVELPSMPRPRWGHKILMLK